jgi:hypothetical protein
MLKETAADVSAAEYSLTGTVTSPNEMVPELSGRAAMRAS